MRLQTVAMSDAKNPSDTILVNISDIEKFKKLGFTIKAEKKTNKDDRSTKPANNPISKDDKAKNKQTGAV